LNLFDLLGLSAKAIQWLGEERATQRFSDLAEQWFFCVDEELLVISQSIKSIVEFRSAKGVAVAFAPASLQAYMDAGFVPAPYTVFAGIYQVPVYSRLQQGSDGVELFLECGPETAGVEPFRDRGSVFAHVNDALSRDERLRSGFEIVCTISGGVDSAVLLSELSRAVGSSRIKAMCCRMPGFDNEVTRAGRVAEAFGVPLHVFEPKNLAAGETVKRFVVEQGGPVFDPVVPVISAMLAEHQERSPHPNEPVILVEGQGADTALIGLPHNMALALYSTWTSPLFRLLARLLPTPYEELRKRQRSLYRIAKVCQMLGAPTWSEALLKALDFQASRYPALHESIKRVLEYYAACTNDRQKAVSLFFLNILHVREMQKYRIFKGRVQCVLPFLDYAFLQRCLVTPTSFFLRRGRRKIPIMEEARARFPGLFSGSNTTPFVVDYSLPSSAAGDGDAMGAVRQYSIACLRTLYNIKD